MKQPTRQETLKNWELKAKEVYQDSLKLMKEGFHGLEVMAGKTMEITKIKIANQKALHHVRGLFTELGQRTYDAIRHQAKGYIKITPDINSFADQIRKWQLAIESNLERLRHVTTVSKETVKVSQPNKIKKSPSSKKKTSPKRRKR